MSAAGGRSPRISWRSISPGWIMACTCLRARVAAARACAGIGRKPLVVTHHGFERFENYGTLARRLFVFLTANFFVDFLFARADALIAVSPFFASRSRYLKKYMDKTVSIPNGIDLEEYQTPLTAREARSALSLPDAAPVILFVGSL